MQIPLKNIDKIQYFLYDNIFLYEFIEILNHGNIKISLAIISNIKFSIPIVETKIYNTKNAFLKKIQINSNIECSELDEFYFKHFLFNYKLHNDLILSKVLNIDDLNLHYCKLYIDVVKMLKNYYINNQDIEN